MTKTHRGRAPLYTRLGAQPMPCNALEGVEMKPSPLAGQALIHSLSRHLHSEASLLRDFGRCLSQVPLLKPPYLGEGKLERHFSVF